MRLNKKTIAVSTAALTIIGGAAFAYVANQATSTGSGSLAAGSIAVSKATTSPLVLGVAGNVTFEALASGDQVESIAKVTVAADTAAWDTTNCGASTFFTGGIYTPASPVTVSKDSSAPTLFTATGVATLNDSGADQTNCVPKIIVTVN